MIGEVITVRIKQNKDKGRIMKIFYILMSALLLTLASCSKEGATTMGHIDGTFVLHSFDGNEITIPADKRFPTLKFDNANKKVTGFTGCNTVNGSFEALDGTIKIGPLAATRKACIKDDYEPKILQALDNATRYEITEDRLILKKAPSEESEILIIFRKLKMQ